MNSHLRSNRMFVVWLTCYLSWMGVIFWLSSQSYAAQSLIPWMQKMIQLQTLMQWLPDWQFTFGNSLISDDNPYRMFEFFIRKASHVGAFFILTTLGFAVFRYRVNRVWYLMLIVSLLSLLYACFDEWHQTWVVDRTGQAIDVAIDAAGIVLGNLFYFITRWWRRKKSNL
jgi:VanZ family protein